MQTEKQMQQPEAPHRQLSAEQFAVPLTDPNCISQLEAMADAAGFELHIVIFIRSQLDYINSRYIYSLRRFYHHQTFEQFVDDALKGKLQNENPNEAKSNVGKMCLIFGTISSLDCEGEGQGFEGEFPAIPPRRH